MIEPERRLLYSEEVCRVLGVTREQLRGMVRRGELPQPGKLGRRVVWRRDHIESAVERITATA